MESKLKEDLVSRLDLLQQSVWNSEEQLIKYLGMSQKHQVELETIKSNLELMCEKINKIGNEIRGLRLSNGTA